jgi:hypothetical protein
MDEQIAVSGQALQEVSIAARGMLLGSWQVLISCVF